MHSPADYFGRTMILNLPDSIRVGVINVSVGGCDIRLFDKDIYQDYDSTYTESWFLSKVEDYEWNPYQYLIDLALSAQGDGVIKGILLHQGETNTGQDEWPSYVKKIYNDMINDLGLNADSIPLLAGEVLYADQGGDCASMNSIIAVLPDTLPNSYVISADGCPGMDQYHFNSEGYRILGIRYAKTMLSTMGYDTTDLQYPETSGIDPEDQTSGYMLEQNSPNPFNPTTSIRYYLPQKAKVILEILDVTGRTIEKLVDNIESSGKHTVTFDGSGLTSGTYLYRLTTSTGYEQTRKMLLVK
ncbi:MAG: sialate O-acetylesterase [candidate division WOR-3 bacterium]